MAGFSDFAASTQPLLSNGVRTIRRSPALNDFRTYYRFTLLTLSIGLFFELLSLLLVLILFEPFSLMYKVYTCGLSAVYIYAIWNLLNYSQSPGSDNWLATAQGQMVISALVSFAMFSYAVYLRSVGSMWGLCYSGERYTLGCLFANVLYICACATPFAMLIASLMIFFKSLGRRGIFERYNVCDLDESFLGLP